MSMTVSAEALRGFATACYDALGMKPEDAALVADTLVQADLWGHPSHGILRLFWYAARIKSGATNLQAEPKIDDGFGALASMDGQDGMGHVAAKAAIERAIALSKTHGIGAVSVRNAGHFGTAMYYTRMAAEAGCVGFLCANASPAMAPWGGVEKRLGTNPWSWAAPAGRFPLLMLDMANTAVARGKLYVARQKGEAIPDFWAMDTEGKPTTDPVAGIAGTILPMAGHKGYGIALVVDMLSGVLSGSGFGRQITGPYVPEGRSGVGFLAFAINIEALRPLAAFEADMEALITDLKETPRSPGVSDIHYPGELEALSAERLGTAGIELPAATVEELRRESAALGVDWEAWF